MQQVGVRDKVWDEHEAIFLGEGGYAVVGKLVPTDTSLKICAR